ncbi:MAG: endonuclease V [Halobacteria archaeon]
MVDLEVKRSELLPLPSMSREEMLEIQRRASEAAVFESPGSDGFNGSTDFSVADHFSLSSRAGSVPEDPFVAVGVDQAFQEDSVVAAAVAIEYGSHVDSGNLSETETVAGDVVQGKVVSRSYAERPVETPYIPGLLSYREGMSVVEVLTGMDLETEPDFLLLDGSGRIHYRQAGLATHVGVVLDLPAVGVAKSLLCGEPYEGDHGNFTRKVEKFEEKGFLDGGEALLVRADEDVEGEGDIGYVYQTRQYDTPEKRHINPVYISPGHLVTNEAAVELVERTVGRHKLPEPVFEADRYADEVKNDL